MNDFFRSKTFKIIAVLLAAVLAFFLHAVYTGGLMPALSHIGGAVATPFGKFFAGIGNAVEDFFQPILHGRELQHIRIIYEPDIKNHPKVIFKVLNETVASTDGMCILGKKEGTTQFEAYCYGSNQPFEVIVLNIIKRNRIKQLLLSDNELVLGIGDTRKLQCDFFPVDADNTNSIVWSSTDVIE